jgi:hypothetical protein
LAALGHYSRFRAIPLRFSIRDLLLVTMIVALTVGWWVDRRAWTQKYSDKEHESEIWQTRTEELQVRADRLVERLSVKVAPTSSAPAPNPSKP